MKKLGILALAVPLLTACGGKEQVFLHNIDKVLLPMEKTLLASEMGTSQRFTKHLKANFPTTYVTLYKKRLIKKGDKSSYDLTLPEAPFCDILEEIRTDIVVNNLPGEMFATYKKITGVELGSNCSNPSNPSNPSNLVQEAEPTTPVPINEVVSISMRKELLAEFPTCTRAKHKYFELTKDKPALTYEDYTEVKNIIFRCLDSKLETQANK